MGPTWVMSVPDGPHEPCYLGSCKLTMGGNTMCSSHVNITCHDIPKFVTWLDCKNSKCSTLNTFTRYQLWPHEMCPTLHCNMISHYHQWVSMTTQDLQQDSFVSHASVRWMVLRIMFLSQQIFTVKNNVNSSPPTAAYLCQRIGSTLVLIMACHLFGAKPLSKSMLGYCQLNP